MATRKTNGTTRNRSNVSNVSKSKEKQMPEPVDRIQNHLNRFMAFTTDDQPLVISLWTLHTWQFRVGYTGRTPWVTPYLYIFSDGPACGKSTLLEILSTLVSSPRMSGDMTPAALVRVIGQAWGDTEDEEETDGEAISPPTLFVDEVDTVWSGGARVDPLRVTMNTGYKHTGYATRVVSGVAKDFRTFCAKVLAGIRDDSHQIPETVQTRSLPIVLKRSEHFDREVYYSFLADEEAEEIRAEIEIFMREAGPQIDAYMPKPDGSLTGRKFELALPLLQIAHFLGIEDEARTAIENLLNVKLEGDTPEVTLLKQIHTAFGGRDRIFTRDLIEAIGVTGKRFSGMISGFVVGTSTTLSIGDTTLKGYHRHNFQAAWDKYGIGKEEGNGEA